MAIVTNRLCRYAWHRLVQVTTLLLLATGPVNARTLTLCMDQADFAPFTYAKKEGTFQVLIKMAAKRANLAVALHIVPWARCRERLARGDYDAAVALSATPVSLRFAVFPTRTKQIDPTQALGATTAYVFRRVGSRAAWNGKTFTNVSFLLIPSAYGDMQAAALRLGVKYDDGAKDIRQNFQKLLGNHGDAAIAYLNDGRKLLADTEFRGKIEMLPEPFFTTYYYLSFSKQFFAKSPDIVQNMWTAIQETRESAGYKAAIAGIR
jgi:polar amino acid transport system substrate-binding protein